MDLSEFQKSNIVSSMVLIGITLLVRLQAQGIEKALFGTAVEYGVYGARSALRLLRLSR